MSQTPYQGNGQQPYGQPHLFPQGSDTPYRQLFPQNPEPGMQNTGIPVQNPYYPPQPMQNPVYWQQMQSPVPNPSYGQQSQQPVMNPYTQPGSYTQQEYFTPQQNASYYQQPSPYGQAGAAPAQLSEPNPYQQLNQQTAQQPPLQDPYAQAAAYQQNPYDPGMNDPMANGYSQPVDFGTTPVQTTAEVEKLKPDRIHILQILLILLILGAGAWYVITNLVPSMPMYGTVTAGTLGARYKGECLVVRDEIPYNADGVSSVSYNAEEGALLHRSDNICRVYSSGYSTKETIALQTSRDSIRDYQLKLLSAESTFDARMSRVESDVLNRALEIRDMIAGAPGNLINQERMMGAAIQSRQQYLKQKYATDQRMSRLLDDEQAQRQRIESWTKQYVATGEGIVSFYSDGYEYSVNAGTYTDFSPIEVRNMINGYVPEKTGISKSKATVYRIVQDGQWYVLFLSRNAAWNPVDGQTYELMLDSNESTAVSATVISFSRTGGELLVRLQIDGPVKSVLYTRATTGEIGDYVSRLCVPAKALYKQDGSMGVVVVDSSNQSFIPVNVVEYIGEDAYIESIQPGLLHEGQTVMLF